MKILEAEGLKPWTSQSRTDCADQCQEHYYNPFELSVAFWVVLARHTLQLDLRTPTLY